MSSFLYIMLVYIGSTMCWQTLTAHSATYILTHLATILQRRKSQRLFLGAFCGWTIHPTAKVS